MGVRQRMVEKLLQVSLFLVEKLEAAKQKGIERHNRKIEDMIWNPVGSIRTDDHGETYIRKKTLLGFTRDVKLQKEGLKF